MLPVPVKADEHEAQGLMGSGDIDDELSYTAQSPSEQVTTSALGTRDATILPVESNNATSLSAARTDAHTQSLTGAKQAQQRISQRDVNKRIQSYLRESDENCRESATLVAIVVIGLIVTGSVIGFLQLGHHDTAALHKGSHASIAHFDGEELPSSLPLWLRNKTNLIDREVVTGAVDEEDTLGIQPLYRNYVLQTLYEYSFQTAIRVDKNDPIFQHISMTYGGPWDVPAVIDSDADDRPSRRRRMQPNHNNNNNDDAGEIDGDSDTEKVVIDDQSLIRMISLENGRNDHTFTVGEGTPGYAANLDQWHCYIFEFANADQLVTKAELWNAYTFKISVIFDNFAMESGYDFVRVYVNSEYAHSLTGSYDAPQTLTYRVDFAYLNQWQENDIPSFEVCLNVVTDESVQGRGFDVTTKIEYENPEIVSWDTHADGDDACFVAKPTWRNPTRWDGTCGIGVQRKKIVACDEDKLANLVASRRTPGVDGGDDADADELADELDASGLFRGVCVKNEEIVSFCKKKDCGDAPVPMDNKEVQHNPKLKYNFNGYGRIDPTFADAFTVQRSTNIGFNIESIIGELEKEKLSIESEYTQGGGDVRVLLNAVHAHATLDDSQVRLGLKLARSLLLGDTFHAVFTGSSNTAGHDNLFLSSYPMQLQSILRPLWKRIGYKGAAFKVSNRAVGGAIGSDQLSWCVPQITAGIAEKVDVVVWESLMNDAGSDTSRRHTLENHLRNVLTMTGGTFGGNVPNRPLWHAVIAGSNGNEPRSFEKSMPLYGGYADLIGPYGEYGAGIVEFNPSLGLNPMKAQQNALWKDEHFYVTWHPGPVGHRVYAEIIAHFYLEAVLLVLRDVQKTVTDLEHSLQMTESIAQPILEMLSLLQDAPYKAGLPETSHTKKCKPVCTDAPSSFCMLGYNPKDMVYDLAHFVVDAHGWKYVNVAGNPQPLSGLDGGQASLDTKYGYKGNKKSGALVLSVKIAGNKLMLLEKPYADWGGLNDVLKSLDRWLHAQIVQVIDIVIEDEEKQKDKERIIKNEVLNKKLSCDTKDGQLWMRNVLDFGCVFRFPYAGKYHVALTVDVDEEIPICVIATF